MKKLLLSIIIIFFFTWVAKTQTYTISSSSTTCGASDETCSSNGFYYNGDVIRLTNLSMSGSTVSGRVVKCDYGTYRNDGWINFRALVCDDHSTNYNASEINFYSGNTYINFSFDISGEFSSDGEIDFMCTLASVDSDLGITTYYHTKTLTITRTSNSGTPPSSPTNISATATSSSSISVSWNSVSDADEYKVYLKSAN